MKRKEISWAIECDLAYLRVEAGIHLDGTWGAVRLNHRDRSKPRERILKKLRDKVAI